MSECLGHYSILGVVRTLLPEKLIYEQPLQSRERERERESERVTQLTRETCTR